MIVFHPIDIGIQLDGRRSDLIGFDWRNRTADFVIPNDDQRVLRAQFGDNDIIRLLDEMPISIESDHTARTGLVPGHFAYRVEGHPFLEDASPTWKSLFGELTHFTLVTGWGCLDALTADPVTFSVVPVRE
jgi:hypothetical protein